MKRKIDIIEETFFNDLVLINSRLSHAYDDGNVYLGWNGDYRNIYESLFHEMGHFIYAKTDNVLAKSNWGFKTLNVENLDINWFNKMLKTEAKVMKVAWVLINYYNIESWNISIEKYCSKMAEGLLSSLNFFLKYKMHVCEELIDLDAEEMFLTMYDVIFKEVSESSLSFEEIKKLWFEKIKKVKCEI